MFTFFNEIDSDVEGMLKKNAAVAYKEIESQQLVDEAAKGGVEYLVCANTPITTMDDIKSSIAVLNKTDEACKKAGIGFP